MFSLRNAIWAWHTVTGSLLLVSCEISPVIKGYSPKLSVIKRRTTSSDKSVWKDSWVNVLPPPIFSIIIDAYKHQSCVTETLRFFFIFKRALGCEFYDYSEGSNPQPGWGRVSATIGRSTPKTGLRTSIDLRKPLVLITMQNEMGGTDNQNSLQQMWKTTKYNSPSMIHTHPSREWV